MPKIQKKIKKIKKRPTYCVYCLCEMTVQGVCTNRPVFTHKHNNESLSDLTCPVSGHPTTRWDTREKYKNFFLYTPEYEFGSFSIDYETKQDVLVRLLKTDKVFAQKIKTYMAETKKIRAKKTKKVLRRLLPLQKIQEEAKDAYTKAEAAANVVLSEYYRANIYVPAMRDLVR